MAIPLITAGMIAGGLTTLSLMIKKAITVQKSDSLVQFTSGMRVEPITMIDKRLEQTDYLADILQTLLSLFSGYYLQAVSCMTNVGNINVVRMLDSLNPNRDKLGAAASFVDNVNSVVRNRSASLESYEDCVSLEDFWSEAKEKSKKYTRTLDAISSVEDELTGEMRKSNTITNGNADVSRGIKAAHEAVNLAVGKLLEVNIESDGQKASFPISVRLAPAIVDSEVLVHILGGSGKNNSWDERVHRWKSGELSFWRDLVLCQDMIDDQKRLLLKDKSGALAEVSRRRANNKVAAAASGNPSIGSASALVVLSKDSAAALERANVGKMSDPKFMDEVFFNALTMIVAVVDVDYETVTFYTRGIRQSSKFSIRQLKTANKGSNFDVGELFKMFRMGQSPI